MHVAVLMVKDSLDEEVPKTDEELEEILHEYLFNGNYTTHVIDPQYERVVMSLDRRERKE